MEGQERWWSKFKWSCIADVLGGDQLVWDSVEESVAERGKVEESRMN